MAKLRDFMPHGYVFLACLGIVLSSCLAPRQSSEVPSEYMAHVVAAFADRDSAAKIPLEGEVIQVETPNIGDLRNDEIGLEELAGGLDPVLREDLLRESTGEPPVENPVRAFLGTGPAVDVKIEHTGASPFLLIVCYELPSRFISISKAIYSELSTTKTELSRNKAGHCIWWLCRPTL